MHYDHINMILLKGPTRESVERLPGYHENDAHIIRYKTRFGMDQDLMMEAKSVRGKRKEQRAILEKMMKDHKKMMKDHKEMEERKEVEKLKRKREREREIEKKEEMKKRENERWCSEMLECDYYRYSKLLKRVNFT